MSVSTRTRFEVFKRDHFTCQYCGRKAPSVVLHCDHIQPKAEGGSESLFNLITACADCNLGKNAVPLDDLSAADKVLRGFSGRGRRGRPARDALPRLYLRRGVYAADLRRWGAGRVTLRDPEHADWPERGETTSHPEVAVRWALRYVDHLRLRKVNEQLGLPQNFDLQSN